MYKQRVVLISCSKEKFDVRGKVKARILYSKSSLFKKSLAYAECISNDIYIISAKYGLLRLDEIITTYDETLNGKTRDELTIWGEKVAKQIHTLYDVSKTEFVILGGKNYCAPLQKHLPITILPLRGFRWGERLAWLNTASMRYKLSMCHRLHDLFNTTMPRLKWDMIDGIHFDSGIYIVFENGEKYDCLDRIVRVGTHCNNGRLKERLKDHFIKENKDASIFRKNIGKAILNKNNHPYLPVWNKDMSKSETAAQIGNTYDPDFQQKLEKQISKYLRENFTFFCFPVATKDERLCLEKGIIATLNRDSDFAPDSKWLGRYHPECEISQSGMWLKQGLDGSPLSENEYSTIELYCSGKSHMKPQTSNLAFSSKNTNIKQIKTPDIVQYISNKMHAAKAAKKHSITLVSGDIHKELGLISRMPMVCRAMRKLMNDGDKIHHAPPKGDGATLKIEYFL